MQVEAAPVPATIPAGIPPGLEFLLSTNQVVIQEIREWGFFPVNYRKQYNIMDSLGRRMFYAAENSEKSGSVYCPGNLRYWTIDILDHAGNIVLSGRRTGGMGCQSNRILVLNPTSNQQFGEIIQQRVYFGTYKWNIVDGAGQPVFLLDSPFLKYGFWRKDFPLMTFDEPPKQVGRVSKEFTGIFAREDVFGVEFSADLDVQIKAVLIYAAFLIDFMFYEDHGHQHIHHSYPSV